MNLPPDKKIYFASDFHLGIPHPQESRDRERRLCRWFDYIRKDAARIYLVGDLFDVWFEYDKVIPKGYSRFFGKLAELRDEGIVIEAFTGNHDLWMKGYFEDEFNIPVHKSSVTLEVNGKRFFIAHGDGLGPGDHGYKFLKKVMSGRLSQWLYRRLHPDTGVRIATYFSRKGAKHDEDRDAVFLGEDKEWLVLFCKEMLQKEHFDYFIFGHRHLPMTLPLAHNSLYINLGDWIRYDTYAAFDGNTLTLTSFEK